jgi:hypothetical protein
MEIRQHQFQRRDLELGMDVHGNAAAVVANGAGAIDVQRHLNARAVAGKMLVDGVVQHFKNAVVQAALIGRPNVHSGALADACQALELVDF